MPGLVDIHLIIRPLVCCFTVKRVCHMLVIGPTESRGCRLVWFGRVRLGRNRKHGRVGWVAREQRVFVNNIQGGIPEPHGDFETTIMNGLDPLCTRESFVRTKVGRTNPTRGCKVWRPRPGHFTVDPPSLLMLYARCHLSLFLHWTQEMNACCIYTHQLTVTGL